MGRRERERVTGGGVAQPGPMMEEGHIVGNSAMSRPGVMRLAAAEDDEQVSVMVPIEKVIEGAEEEGPHQRGLVGRFESEFVKPPAGHYRGWMSKGGWR